MFSCSQCEKSYPRKSHLIRHELTHTNQLSASCPICKKEFQKPEVARRHSIICAKKHNQPVPPAGRAGRKKLSCDECFSARTACDRVIPCCSRCRSLGRRCSLEKSQENASCSTVATVSKPVNVMTSGYRIDDKPYYFLLHFTDPSVKKDRLAISETAGYSIRRNLTTVYSSLENAAVSTNNNSPMQFLIGDLIMDPGLLTFGNNAALEESFPMDEFLSEDAFTSTLPDQLHKIAIELVETSRSMHLGTDSRRDELRLIELNSLFTVQNLSVFITAYFQSLHWHMPIVHCPTFDPARVSNCLLLAIFLAGAVYAVSFNKADLPPILLSVAEEYIFRKVANLATVPNPSSSDQLVRGATLETVQAALIIEMLQFSQGDPQIRRRIRIIRNPCLVSTIRSFGLFHFKRRMTPVVCDEDKWRDLVEEEICVRIACWTFLADGFLTVCFKNHPCLTIFEMDCDFPWSTELFEAESVSSFNEIIVSDATPEAPLPTLRKVAEGLLQMPSNSAGRVPWDRSLSVEHLLLLIYAMNSLAFQARSGLLGFISMDTIKRAAMNWRKLWKSVLSHLQSRQAVMMMTPPEIVKTEPNLHLGYPKHAEELWWLLMTTLDIENNSSNRERSFQYMDSADTDDLGKLNEFIQFASPRTGII